MNDDPSVRRIRSILVFILILLAATSTTAQTTVGFADPHDLQALLDYRLPTWSYRTWTLTGNVAGGGQDFKGVTARNIDNRFNSDLSSDLAWRHEGETTYGALTTSLGGVYSHNHTGSASSDLSRRQLHGQFDVSGTVHRYIRPDGFFVGVSADGSRSYDDHVERPSGADETATYSRATRYGLGADVGVGRVRNVTPLVRARRLSERLAALGRPRLTPAQERQVASVLARDYGYEAVYDRPDRHFWEDVLEPLLGDGEPLSPYEVLYLRDVLDEVNPSRQEGAMAELSPELRGYRTSGTYGVQTSDRQTVHARAAWYHNLSLDHQLGATLDATYEWWRGGGVDREDGRAYLELRHLWVVADRNALSTYAALSRSYSEMVGAVSERGFGYRISSSLRTYVEDALSVFTGVSLDNAQRTYDSDGEVNRSWRWTYRLGVEYALDRLLW